MRTQPKFFLVTCRIRDLPSVALGKVEQPAWLKTLSERPCRHT